jgi:hypothetical protein
LLPTEAAGSLIFERMHIVGGVETIGPAQADSRTLVEWVAAPFKAQGSPIPRIGAATSVWREH